MDSFTRCKASNGGTERILPQNESSMEVIAPILNIEYQLDVEDRIAKLEKIVEGYESGDVFKNARTGFIIDQRGTITDPDTMVSANYYISDRNRDCTKHPYFYYSEHEGCCLCILQCVVV